MSGDEEVEGKKLCVPPNNWYFIGCAVLLVDEIISAGILSSAEFMSSKRQDSPDGISSSAENETCLPTLTTSATLVSYRKRFMCSIRTGGSASISTCCFASRTAPGRVGMEICTG